ncbi:LysR family transcriptional regulator [Azoarcus sp. KH32C]|uniref:LysR family transcriptional regulator n=1 Tax=Azoarcus sp. KH32C TaxID=748247 RepID=UPI0002386D26|nr:LysR family transcriptional regulator [Azoarcus sp. KH32C]BAL22781.1 transcriptional regulator, LysR family [Azoarcus sp. KH32C]
MKARALLANLAEADLRLLRVFIAIAESGGLAAAELRLNISRSVISRHLKDLELRLGVRLCERGRAGFALTEEGEVVLDAARRLLAQIEQFRSEVAELHAGMRGELNLVMFDKTVSNPGCRLAEAIAEFGAEAPAVTLNVHVAGSSEIEKGLLEGRFHVAVHPFHRASDSFTSVHLFDEFLPLYAAPDHPLLAGGRVPDDDELRRAAFVGLGYHSPNMEHFWRLGLQPAARAFEQEASVLLIRSGRYIGFLPDHYARAFEERGEIVRIASETLRYSCDWLVSVARNPPPGRIARRFMEILVAQHSSRRII